MKNELTIKLGDYEIVAEINAKSEPEIPPELCVYLRDKDGCITQDICLVRPNYRYNRHTGEFERSNDFVDCLVWGESGYEDFTDDFTIGVYEWEEE